MSRRPAVIAAFSVCHVSRSMPGGASETGSGTAATSSDADPLTPAIVTDQCAAIGYR